VVLPVLQALAVIVGIPPQNPQWMDHLRAAMAYFRTTDGGMGYLMTVLKAHYLGQHTKIHNPDRCTVFA
jgi:hypothetical protein